MTSSRDVAEINSTDQHHSTFILLGIPGLEYAHIWIAIPFCVMYIIAVVANCIILYIIKTEESLHSPMFFFFCMLAGADLIMTNATMPKALGVFWFNLREISLNSCVIQMFFAHGFALFESGVLTLMALDRYVAICNPLRYSSILTNRRIAVLGLAYLFKCVLCIGIYPFLVKRLHYCKSNIISNTYCEHMSVAKLSCTSFEVNIYYGLSVVLLTVVSDLTLIVSSYIMILRAVFHLPTSAARWKALSTCLSHVSVMVVFYVPLLATVFIQRYVPNALPYVHIIVANLYYLVPPTVNPVIYGIRTKQIRNRIISMICCGKSVMWATNVSETPEKC